MNKQIISMTGAAVAASVLFSSAAFAASTNGNASATVLAPLTITAGAGMDFGNVAGATGSATTVVLTPAGATSSGDGATVGGTSAAGAFTVTGDDSLTYDISLPASTTLTGGSGPAITVNNFTSSKTGNSSNTSGGNDSFTVGATLNLSDGQGSGTYTGTYAISVDYQ